MANKKFPDDTALVTPQGGDLLMIADISDGNKLKEITVDDVKDYTKGAITTDDIAEGITNEYDKVVAILAGAGIQVTGTYPNFTVTNSSPDQVVALTAGTNVTITGTYPNFTINATGGSGSGTGDVTASGTLTADKIILGDGTKVVKTSSKGITTTLGTDDTTLPTSKAVKDITDTKFTYLYGGCLTTQTFTNNGDGTVTLPNIDVVLYNNQTFSGIPNKYTLSGLTNQALTDNTQNYIVGDYNNGNPIMKVITNVELITESDVIPILSIYRNGIYLHVQNWDSLGLGLANKVHQSIVKTQRYRRESGLTIGQTGTRNITLTQGKIWTGAVPLTLDAINTSTGDNIFLWYHSAGVWTQSVVTQYNNTQYDNGTNLVSLTSNRYAVNWIFRGVESQKHLYCVLGVGDYTLSQAQSATVPSLPTAISSHATLVGKIIVQTGSNAGTIQSAFDTSFTYSGTTSHSDLTNLSWTSSGHTGTATRIAGFADTTGASSEIQVGSGLSLAGNVLSATGGGSNPIFSTNIDGQVYTGTIARFVAKGTQTIAGVKISLGSLPTGANFSVDVRKNGTATTNSIFASDTPISITTGQSATNGIYVTTGTSIDNGSLVENDVLYVVITLIGSTLPGSDFECIIF